MAHGATPRSLCERYNDENYESLRDDETRTGAYLCAIAAAAPGRVCLDIGTGALALLAIAAARAGAKRVFAVEANSKAAEEARRAILVEGLQSIITVVEGFSTDIVLPSEEPVDLLIHEIIGEVAGAEGVYAAIADARLRHCGGLPVASVPARAVSWVVPSEWPSAEYFEAQPIPLLAPPGSRALLLPALPAALRLAAPRVFEDLGFTASGCAPLQEHSLEFDVSRAGLLRGLSIWIEIFVADADATTAEISSAEEASRWSNVFLLLPQPIPVRCGAKLLVATRAAVGGAQPNYVFDVALRCAAEEHDDEEVPTTKQLATLRYPEDPLPPDVGWTEDECLVESW